MGHLLGFHSSVGDRELDPADALALNIWDIFRFRPGTANLGNFEYRPANTTFRWHAGAVQWRVRTRSFQRAGPMATAGDGEQASHWKADEQSGVYLLVSLDPSIARGQRYTMTANDQNAIDFFGYTITTTTPPANDNFVNAQLITGNSGTVNWHE